MTKQCKYAERNEKERKCSNYFWSIRDGKFIKYNDNPQMILGEKIQGYHKSKVMVMCRLSEWKKKKGVCPYDSSIQSHRHQLKILAIGNKKLGEF